MGHTLTIVNPAEIVLDFAHTEQGGFPVQWRGRAYPLADLTLPLARWNDNTTWQIAETLQSWGRAITVPQRVPLGDHISMARLMARRSIPAPRSWVLSHPEQLQLLLTDVKFPILMRSRYGGTGRKVAVVQHSGEAFSHASSLASSGQTFLVQDLPEPLGQDVRVLVVGDKIVAAVARKAPAGFVRPKEAGNADVRPTTLNSEEERVALAAARLYGASFCAVSLLRTNTGPLMLELSRVPTLVEFESLNGADYASMILTHLAEMAYRLKAASNTGSITSLRQENKA
jgi:ribosomal protein S6--L-glutamate ligase